MPEDGNHIIVQKSPASQITIRSGNTQAQIFYPSHFKLFYPKEIKPKYDLSKKLYFFT